ncbi:MAG: hypothetical protein ISN29_07745 [Gammaproteobacteria bacterium AqS3]|nr:hypothetical protein [Gammaproteobacteria bacterium AqS3]
MLHCYGGLLRRIITAGIIAALLLIGVGVAKPADAAPLRLGDGHTVWFPIVGGVVRRVNPVDLVICRPIKKGDAYCALGNSSVVSWDITSKPHKLGGWVGFYLREPTVLFRYEGAWYCASRTSAGAYKKTFQVNNGGAFDSDYSITNPTFPPCAFTPPRVVIKKMTQVGTHQTPSIRPVSCRQWHWRGRVDFDQRDADQLQRR